MKVQHKTIIVTGAGSGMGRALVIDLLQKGATVIGVDINESALKETVQVAAENSTALKTYIVDITNRNSIEEFAGKMLANNAVVDGIINNAGIIQPFIKVNDLPYDMIEKVMNVNFNGTLYMIKTFLPHLLTRPEAHIVNISSMGGFLPVPGQTIYGASKAAVKLLTEGLHSELSGTNVTVTVVFPGAVSTNILKNSGLNLPEPKPGQKARAILSPEKAAQLIVNGMEHNLYRVLIGKDSRMMDFFYRLHPRSAASMIAKQMSALLSG